jgi:hypothetical protein
MDAMGYEYLVRRAYQCGRFGSPGANADIYRKMERAFYSLTIPTVSNKTKEGLEYDCRHEAATVRSYVLDAINKGMKQIYDEADNEKLKLLKSKLHIMEYDKNVLDEVIEEASGIFRKHKLEAR